MKTKEKQDITKQQKQQQENKTKTKHFISYKIHTQRLVSFVPIYLTHAKASINLEWGRESAEP